MTNKILYGLFASIFLLALVSSLSISDIQLGNVDPGQTVDFSVVLNNTANPNTYSVDFSQLSGLTLSDTTVGNNTSKTIQASYVVPTNKTGINTFKVSYNYTNTTTSNSDFDVFMTISGSPLQITKLQELTYTQNGKVRVHNSANSALEVALSSSGNADVTLSSESFTLDSQSSKDIEVSALDVSRLAFGNNPITITASSSAGSDSVQFNLAKSFCSAGTVGNNLSIDNVDISSTGEKDNKWKFLDVVTVEVRVKDTGNDDVDNVVVELALFDSNGNDVSGDLDFLNDGEESIDVGDLNDGDKETATFEFRVPADFDTGSYKLAVKTYSDDLSQTQLCADRSSDLSNTLYESVSVEEESDEGRFIGFDNIELSTSDFTCSESGSISFEAFNVGDKSQDRVRIKLYNDALDIEQTYEIKSDFDTGDSEDIKFNFDIPSNAKDGNYILFLTADYDYKSGAYRQGLDEDYEVPIKVMGCSVVPTSDRVVSISADYDSAKAGSDLVVDAVVRNLAKEDKTFLITASDYSSWAELVSISDRTLNLGAGESQVVTITLKVNEDASAEESFTINAVSDSKTESEEVPVIIQSSSGFSLSKNSWVWIIGAVNLVLIILIILVAIKLSRR